MPIVWKDDVLPPSAYVEHWRVTLWDHAYLAYLAPTAGPKFAKGTDLQKFENGMLIIKLLVYRYYMPSAYYLILLSTY